MIWRILVLTASYKKSHLHKAFNPVHPRVSRHRHHLPNNNDVRSVCRNVLKRYISMCSMWVVSAVVRVLSQSFRMSNSISDMIGSNRNWIVTNPSVPFAFLFQKDPIACHMLPGDVCGEGRMQVDNVYREVWLMVISIRCRRWVEVGYKITTEIRNLKRFVVLVMSRMGYWNTRTMLHNHNS